uniref:FAS1 domain-containing protein n=1 Tax=Dunaliella tertiolecta TaxID=3047 RepID=A0A7S3R841_DUNTE
MRPLPMPVLQDLLGGAEAPDGATFEHFKAVLGHSMYPSSNDFITTHVTGSFLAFTDAAFENFAVGHGFENATVFMEWLGEKDGDARKNMATEMINLHIIPSLNSDTTDSAGIDLAQTKGNSGLVKLMFDGDGKVAGFIYPTFKRMPDDSSETEKTENSSNETDGESVSRRQLLNDHGVSSLMLVNGGDPVGSKQCYYLNETALAPVSLVNMMASRKASVYDAISAVPALSMFKAMLDSDLDDMRALRGELSATDFDGTLLAPHDDAIAAFLDDLDVDLPKLRDDFPALLVSMVEYHILPYNFTIADLTKPGNGKGNRSDKSDKTDKEERTDNDGKDGTDKDEGSDKPDQDGTDNNSKDGTDDCLDGTKKEGTDGCGESSDEESAPPPPPPAADEGNGEEAERIEAQSNRALLSYHGEGGNGNGNGNESANRDDNGNVENRFRTRRPGSAFDLNVVKTGNGRVMIRGRMGKADLMTPDSEISINGMAYIHIIDSVLRVKNVASSKKAADLFGDNSRVSPKNGKSYKRILELLPASFFLPFGDREGSIALGCKTLIAPPDEALEDVSSMGDFFKAHTIHLEPSATYSNGTVFATDLEGTNVTYTEDEEGNGSFSFTDAAVTHDWNEGSCGSSSRKSRRSMLSVSTQRRSLLDSSAGFAGSVSLGDGQIIFSEDAMTSSTGGIPDNGSTWTAAPGLNLVLAALLSMLALLS